MSGGATAAASVTLTHGRIQLALHALRDVPGRPLLLLHGLGESSPTEVPDDVAAWDGPIWALDLSGHGASTVPAGGGYSAELLMADADTVLRHLCASPDDAGRGCVVVGRGLGGYVALLLAGARADLVRGIVIADGPGLAGGPVRPGSNHIEFARRIPGAPTTPDPSALMELATDIRPVDYALRFVLSATDRSSLEQPIVVSAVQRPPWLAAVVEETGVGVAADVAAAIRTISRQL
jgi:pimeloyl-ACP methyl ester carboxylesterase